MLALAFLLVPAQAAVIPSTRTFIDAWHRAGYSGTIPTKTGRSVRGFGAIGDGSADDTAAIRSAIGAAAANPTGGMVYFPAGIYRVTSALSLPSGTILRGARGPKGNLAKLRFDLRGASANCLEASGSPVGATQKFSAQAIHAKWIDVADGSAFASGDTVHIWQANDPAWDFGNPWAANAVGQIVKATKVVGNRVYLEHELRADYLAKFTLTIQKLSVAHDIGIENLIIERADTVKPTGGSTIALYMAANCWVRGCELIRCLSAHIDLTCCANIEIAGNYIHHGFDYGGGGRAYGVRLQNHTGDSLVQNNIFNHLRHSMLFQVGANGNVLGYNYSREAVRSEPVSQYSGDVVFHGNRPFANLVEGNIVCSIQMDTSHGQPAGPYNTIFRNAATVNGIFMSPYRPQADSQNFVGNDVPVSAIFPIWNYQTFGQDHFEYGNRVISGGSYSMTPAGAANLPDISYYLSTNPAAKVKPGWWTLKTPIPTIGPGTPWRGHNNPAKARWDAGGVMTVVL